MKHVLELLKQCNDLASSSQEHTDNARLIPFDAYIKFIDALNDLERNLQHGDTGAIAQGSPVVVQTKTIHGSVLEANGLLPINILNETEIQLYTEVSTGAVFGLEASFLEQTETESIPSPFNPNVTVSLYDTMTEYVIDQVINKIHTDCENGEMDHIENLFHNIDVVHEGRDGFKPEYQNTDLFDERNVDTLREVLETVPMKYLNGFLPA